jgi:hypothetical protein
VVTIYAKANQKKPKTLLNITMQAQISIVIQKPRNPNKIKLLLSNQIQLNYQIIQKIQQHISNQIQLNYQIKLKKSHKIPTFNCYKNETKKYASMGHKTYKNETKLLPSKLFQ